MTKNTDKVRNALTGLKSAIDRPALIERTGLASKEVGSAISSMLKSGVLLSHAGESHHKHRYSLNPDHIKDDPRAKKKSAKKKRAPTDTLDPLTFREVARRHIGGNGSGPSLAQRHIGTTLAMLESIIDLDQADPQVAAAFAAHREAVALAQEMK